MRTSDSIFCLFVGYTLHSTTPHLCTVCFLHMPEQIEAAKCNRCALHIIFCRFFPLHKMRCVLTFYILIIKEISNFLFCFGGIILNVKNGLLFAFQVSENVDANALATKLSNHFSIHNFSFFL